MPDRLFFPLIALVIIAIVGLAAVWPQGDGARSPGPFGHTPTQQTAAAQAARVQAEAAASAERARKAAAERAALAPGLKPAQGAIRP